MRNVMNEQLRKVLGISIAYGGDGAEADLHAAEAEIADAEADPTDALQDLTDAVDDFALAGTVGVPGISTVSTPDGVTTTSATNTSVDGTQAITDATALIGAVNADPSIGQVFQGTGTDPKTGQSYGYDIAVFGNYLDSNGLVTVGIGGSVAAVYSTNSPFGSTANSAFTGTVDPAASGSQGVLLFTTGNGSDAGVPFKFDLLP